MASQLGKKSPVTTAAGVTLEIVDKRNLQIGDRVYLHRRFLGAVSGFETHPKKGRRAILDHGKTLQVTSQGANRFMKEV